MAALKAEREEEVDRKGGQEPCLVCGGMQFRSQFRGSEVRRAGPPPADGYRITHSERRLVGGIRRCVDCGMVFLAAEYIHADAYEDAEDPQYVEQAEQRIENAARLLALVPGQGHLLEIGCACGFLLVAARQRGFTAEGIEISRWGSEHARRAYGLNVKTGTLETVRLDRPVYDVVVLADVIEHLTDPRETVRKASGLLPSGGRLLILTPDVGSLTARLAGRHWWGLLDDHYFYFSRSTLSRFLEQEGFEVEKLRAFGRRFAIGHWIWKLSQYGEAVSRPLRRLTRATGVDAVEVPLNLGDQLACVARKK